MMVRGLTLPAGQSGSSGAGDVKVVAIAVALALLVAFAFSSLSGSGSSPSVADPAPADGAQAAADAVHTARTAETAARGTTSAGNVAKDVPRAENPEPPRTATVVRHAGSPASTASTIHDATFDSAAAVDTRSRVFSRPWPATFRDLVFAALDSLGTETRQLLYASAAEPKDGDVDAIVAVQTFADGIDIPSQLHKVELNPESDPVGFGSYDERVKTLKRLATVAVNTFAADGVLHDHYASLLDVAGVAGRNSAASPAARRRALRTLRAMARATMAWVSGLVELQYGQAQYLLDEHAPGAGRNALRPLEDLRNAYATDGNDGVAAGSEKFAWLFPLVREAAALPNVDYVDPPLLEKEPYHINGKLFIMTRAHVACSGTGRFCAHAHRCPRVCNPEYHAGRRVGKSGSEELLGEVAVRVSGAPASGTQPSSVPIELVMALAAEPRKALNVAAAFVRAGVATPVSVTVRDCLEGAERRNTRVGEVLGADSISVSVEAACPALNRPSKLLGASGATSVAFAVVNSHGLESAIVPFLAAQRLRARRSDAGGLLRDVREAPDVMELRHMQKRQRVKFAEFRKRKRWSEVFMVHVAAAGYAIADVEPDINRLEDHDFTLVSARAFVVSEAWLVASS